MSKDRPGWTWKAPDRDHDRQPLLYEPGNWGDILKGSWALLILRSLLLQSPRRQLSYLDPCAGRPTYPLVEATARRLELVRGSAFARAQSGFRDTGRIASTALVVREACVRAGVECELRVFDADAESLRAWDSVDGARALAVRSGAEALDGAADADLTLVDPYDLFDHWGEWLSRLGRAAKKTLVIAYLYNKSPRSRGHLEQYRRLRSRLASIAARDVAVFLGRVASDAVLPRAYHEVIVAGPPERTLPLRPVLEEATRELARTIAAEGAFEALEGP